MSRTLQNTIMAVIGVITVAAASNGLYLSFLKPGMRIPLLVSGAVLVALAMVSIVRGEDEAEADHAVVVPPGSRREAQATRHESHGHAPLVGWLLLVPFLLLGSLSPSPLGAYAAGRESGSVSGRTTAGGFPVLPDQDPVAVTLTDYSGLALAVEDSPLEGRQVVLTGFVLDDPSGAGWFLTRMAITCCAADGFPVKVFVPGEQPYSEGTWLSLVGRYVDTTAGTGEQPLAVVEPIDVSKIDRPAEPYEQP